jgi:hypothetical protein
VPRIEATEVSPGIFLPLLVVTLNLNGRSLSELGLVDSGADRTMVPASWVEACGVLYGAFGEPQEGSGAGGSFEYKLVSGEVTYLRKTFCTTIQVASPDCNLPGPVLGREDFFTKYVVRFAWHRSPPDFNVDPIK